MSIYRTLVTEFLGEAVSHQWDEKQKHLEAIFNPEMSPLKEPITSKDVGAWQWALKTLGYNIGPTGVDKKFGDYTDSATREFQRDNATTVDGIVGQRTLSIMNAVLAKKGITEIPGYKNSKLPVKPPKAPVEKKDDTDDTGKKKKKSGTTANIPNIDNARKVFDEMKKIGFNDTQSAAWVGCIAGESAFDPSRIGVETDKTTGETYNSYGLVQWNKERFKGLQNFAKKVGGSINSWKTSMSIQIGWLNKELDGSFSSVKERLAKTEDSLEDSLLIMIKYYEIPGNIPAAYKQRLPVARAALEQFGEKAAGTDSSADTAMASNDDDEDVIPTLSESADLNRIKYLIKF
jgi:peptidoglycan hydrolase-like protein with peptidoglycan-binding domain